MQRVLEREIMDDVTQVAAYVRADFADSNSVFLRCVIETCPRTVFDAVDLGCGPGEIALQLARATDARITAVDGSEEMLKYARKAASAAGLLHRVTPHLARLPASGLPEHSFDVVLSKDLLHHLPDPQVLWTEAKRLARDRTVIHVMDLVRPVSQVEARRIVERVSGEEPAVLQRDFYNSLCAAFTVKEVKAQLRLADLDLDVVQVTDRHMRVSGVI